MRKYILVCVLLLVVVSNGFTVEKKGSMMRTMFLIESGLDENYLSINNNAQLLTEFERLMIYKDYSKGAGLQFLGNAFVTFGVGSFLGGDKTGGWVGLTSEVVGLAMIASSMDDYLSYGDNDQYMYGVLIFSASIIYQLIRPFIFCNKYNRKLLSALSPTKVSFNFSPDLRPNVLPNGQLEFVAGAAFSFGF